jgi:hypothetical protein
MKHSNIKVVFIQILLPSALHYYTLKEKRSLLLLFQNLNLNTIAKHRWNRKSERANADSSLYMAYFLYKTMPLIKLEVVLHHLAKK